MIVYGWGRISAGGVVTLFATLGMAQTFATFEGLDVDASGALSRGEFGE